MILITTTIFMPLLWLLSNPFSASVGKIHIITFIEWVFNNIWSVAASSPSICFPIQCVCAVFASFFWWCVLQHTALEWQINLKIVLPLLYSRCGSMGGGCSRPIFCWREKALWEHIFTMKAKGSVYCSRSGRVIWRRKTVLYQRWLTSLNMTWKNHLSDGETDGWMRMILEKNLWEREKEAKSREKVANLRERQLGREREIREKERERERSFSEKKKNRASEKVNWQWSEYNT